MTNQDPDSSDLDRPNPINHRVGSSPARENFSSRLWRGVTLQLFVFTVLPLMVLVLIVTFGSLRLHHEAMRSLVADRNLRAVQSAAASLSREIRHRGDTLALLAKNTDTSEPTQTMLEGYAEEMSIFEGGLAVVSPDERILASTDNDSFQALILQSGWAEVQNMLSASPPGRVTYLPLRRVGEELLAPVIVNTVQGETFIGLFSPTRILSEGLSAVANADTVTVVVVDQRYQVIFQSGSLSDEEDISTHPGIPNALAGGSGIDYLQTDGGEHVIASSPIPPVGWALMIEESWEEIASPLLRLTQNAPVIIVPVLAFALLAIWFGLRQIVQPLQDLEVKTGDLAAGNFISIRQPVGGVPEIQHLQATLIDMAAQLKAAQDSLHNYIGAITDSVETERHSLARELHDDTLQSLIALGQFTQYALHWNKDPKVENTLNQIMDLSEKGTINLRRMVRGLRPIYIEDLGLATALSMQAASYEERPEAAKVHFRQEGQERRFKPEVEIALYRMAQEALSNIHKHSGSKNAWVSLLFQPTRTVLEIRDDGTGFTVPKDPLQYARQGHYGLLGLYERAELIGAKISIHTSAEEGTLIRIQLPANEPAGAGAGG